MKDRGFRPIKLVLKTIGHLVFLIGKPFFWILLVLTVLGAVVVNSFVIFIRRNAVLRIKIRIPLSIYFGFIALGVCFVFWYFVLKDLPRSSDLMNREIEVSTKIFDRNGILLYQIYKDKNRTIVSLDKVPLTARLATLAAEDGEFYSHNGLSFKGMSRAFFKFVQEGKISSGSTITQQLVKNALLSPERTLTRKTKEIILALGVEREYSKDKILEMYLNEVSYGGTAYGIAEAAKTYFDKDVQNLTLAQASLLAGLPKSPTKYSPFGNNRYLAQERQKEILGLMKGRGFITDKEYKDAINEKVVFALNRTPILAPHFVLYTKDILAEKYGDDLLYKGGLEILTTLDMELQKKVEGIVQLEIDNLVGYNVTNGAALVLDVVSGEILAMVGSKDYFDNKIDGNVNVLLQLRQPGSSVKVINYAYALAHQYTVASVLKDSPVIFKVSGAKPYSPQNYDGKYRGNISLRSALAESRNIPAVRVLYSYGVSKMVELGRLMGISSWNSVADYGLSLTLGGGDVKMLDLARAYSTIANQGKKPIIRSILGISNYQNRELYTNVCGTTNPIPEAQAKETGCGEQVIDPRVAFLLTDILRDNNARTPAFGGHSSLVIPEHPEVAVKTGTSNSLRDNVTIGYNQKYLVAVWVGNNDNSPMSRVASGVTGASTIWNKIMLELLKNQPSNEWPVPQGLIQKPVCTFTGTQPCENCPTKTEWFLSENQPPIQSCHEYFSGLKNAEKI
ncbi:hypothetical protein A2382_03280 [Candidatus Woesebacteria bacterium RIFOXYB1_FULL_38_16]|uniref:Uncharacterized protein n=1 Tax=Candidatus Woesebacteria bacterium RIFOXYB1_FULL_38_16 TaxID=1802538 RepID=A0A1F8CTU3_9BACT|nr:MAG: hypothetical protein A2191_04175 [Candidatus Woesebacteria bacterium RIFOXYA1_FULL_38_9]OGM79747.1 MAG: hypothetical protein A2382_03280 [Candidatus Woesebacteria bacterium RIFOXYB1_FULL_38_16]